MPDDKYFLVPANHSHISSPIYRLEAVDCVGCTSDMGNTQGTLWGVRSVPHFRLRWSVPGGRGYTMKRGYKPGCEEDHWSSRYSFWSAGIIIRVRIRLATSENAILSCAKFPYRSFFTTSRVCLKGKTRKTPRVRNDWVDETQSRRPTTNRWTGRITHSTSHAHEQLSILQFPFARWQFGTTNQRWKERYTRLIIRRFAFLHHGIWDCRPTRWLIYISTS